MKELTYEEKFQLLKKSYSTTKEEILEEILEQGDTSEVKPFAMFPRPSAFFDNYEKLVRRFYDEVKNMVIFEELPTGWVYEQEVTYKGAMLLLEHVKDVEIDEETGRWKGCITDARYVLLRIADDVLSVSEYAELYGVEVGTVRQWIRRGKIRTAIKLGNQWIIPKLTMPPSRGYQGAQYRWDPPLKDLPEEYSFLNEYKLATFRQDDKDRTKFIVYLVPKIGENGEERLAEKRIMGTQEREALELFMISRRDIDYVNAF